MAEPITSKWCRPSGCSTRARPTMVITRTQGGGEIAFQAGHAPFLGALRREPHRGLPGRRRRCRTSPCTRGFVEVSGTPPRCRSCPTSAELAEDIDVERAKAALEHRSPRAPRRADGERDRPGDLRPRPGDRPPQGHRHQLHRVSLLGRAVRFVPAPTPNEPRFVSAPTPNEPRFVSAPTPNEPRRRQVHIGSVGGWPAIRSRPHSSREHRRGSAPRWRGCSVRPGCRRCSSRVAAIASGRSPASTTAARCWRPISARSRAERRVVERIKSDGAADRSRREQRRLRHQWRVPRTRRRATRGRDRVERRRR